MNKGIVVIAAVSLSFLAFAVAKSNAQAQGDATAAQKLEKLEKLEALSKQLNLTPEQKEKLLPILKAEAPKIQAIKDDASLSGIQKLQKIKAVHAETDPQVKAILSTQQYDQLQQIRHEEIQKMIEKKRAAQ